MNHNCTHEDQQLLNLLVEGDICAFRKLFEKYSEGIYANCVRFTKSEELAKDLTQDIFTKIWINREKLRGVERFDNYLFTTSRNFIKNTLRNKILVSSISEELISDIVDSSPSLLSSIELKDLNSHIEEAVVQLPAQMQKVFRLSRYEGLSHEEIARQMNISKFTSKTYITRALENIREYLNKKNKFSDSSHQFEQNFFLFFLITTYSFLL